MLFLVTLCLSKYRTAQPLSGTTSHIIPIAKDSQGNEVGLSKAGQLTWTAENGKHFLPLGCIS